MLSFLLCPSGYTGQPWSLWEGTGYTRSWIPGMRITDQVIYAKSETWEALEVDFEPRQLLCHSEYWSEGAEAGRYPQVSHFLEVFILKGIRISFQWSCTWDTLSDTSDTLSNQHDPGMFVEDCTNRHLIVNLVSQEPNLDSVSIITTDFLCDLGQVAAPSRPLFSCLCNGAFWLIPRALKSSNREGLEFHVQLVIRKAEGISSPVSLDLLGFYPSEVEPSGARVAFLDRGCSALPHPQLAGTIVPL